MNSEMASSAASEPPSVGSRRSVRRGLVRVALAAAVAVAAFNVYRNVGNVVTYPGTDLRARVVGARAMLAGVSPYTAPPLANGDERLIDPERYAVDYTRCTYTPALLLLYAPLSVLPYQTQRYAWAALEWGMLGATGWLLWRHVVRDRSPLARALFLGLFFVSIAGAYFWRVHVERGQYYVIILLLLSLGSVALMKGDRAAAGIPLGLAVACRLTPAVLLLPLWLLGYRRAVVGTLAAATVMVVATLPFGGVGLWKDYLYLVRQHERVRMDPAFAAAQKRNLPPVPATAEGVTFGPKMPAHSFNASALHSLHVLEGQGLPLPPRSTWGTCMKIAALTVTFAWAALVAARRRRDATLEPAEAVAVSLVPVLALDFLTPTRYGYADVLWLLPLTLLLPALRRDRIGQGLIVLAAACLLLAHDRLTPLGSQKSTVLRGVGLLGVVTAACTYLLFRTKPPGEGRGRKTLAGAGVGPPQRHGAAASHSA